MRVLAVLLLGALCARAEGPAWSVAPTDVLRYELRTVTVANGKEKFGGGTIVTVGGADLRDTGQYLPVSPALADRPVLFALRLPAAAGPLRFDAKLRHVVGLRARGVGELPDGPGPLVRIVTTWRFASRGAAADGDNEKLVDGEAHVQASFDPVAGQVTEARVRLTYRRRPLEPKPGEKETRVEKDYDLRFVERRAERWEGQQADIDAAIDRGAAYLRTLQRDDATFEPHGDYAIGTTGLALLTLCACGATHEDAAVERGLAWLCAQAPEKNYDRALALMAVDKAYTPAGEAQALRLGREVAFVRDLPAERRAWCAGVAADLEAAAASPGSWAYATRAGSKRAIVIPDSSNTQYAVLGLRAAVRLGLPVREQTWLGVVRHFGLCRERKAPKGHVSLVYEGEVQPVEERMVAAGFQYRPQSPHAWGAMTCAGIASLCIARDELRRAKSARLTAALEREIDEMVLGGWGWLDAHWATDRHPLHPEGRWFHYYLYSLERAGILSRVKRVGGKDWYLAGAAQLLARQKEDGSWQEGGKNHVVATCLALLFLKRATAPVTQGR